jgi:hypothetical protein
MFVASRGPFSSRRRLGVVHPVAGELEALVAGAVRERRAELAARRNGRRLCSTCAERPAQSGRRVCSRCRGQADARRRRERANGVDAEREQDADDAEVP